MEFIRTELNGLMEIGVPLIKPWVPYLIAMVIFVISFFIYFYLPYWRLRKIPGPPTKFLLGHLPLLAEHGPDVLRVLAKEYGPVFRFHMGRQPHVIVADPELCREVGIKRFKDINNRSIRLPTSGSPLHDEGIFLSRDSSWAAKRNLVVSLYQPSQLAGLIPTMQSYMDNLVENISTSIEGEDVPFSRLCTKMAVDVIGETAFGVQFNVSKPIRSSNLEEKDKDDEASSFLKQHKISMESLVMGLSSSLSMILGLLIPFLQNPCREILQKIPGTFEHTMYHVNEKLVERIDAIVAKRSSERTKESKDFLAAILNARESGTVGEDIITDDSIRALTYEHLLAGSKTAVFTLAMTVYLVSKHPEVEKKLLEEIDCFVPRDKVPTAEDLQCKFPYLDLVIKEAMRFRTVSPVVARETSKRVELGGYILPKGTWLWLALGVLAKDPKQFPDPDEFRPERFDPNCDEEKQRHPYAHIPFGIGPRVCVAQKFALQEIKLALIRVYRSYIFRHSPNMESPLEFTYGLVLEFKHGVKLHAIKRQV